MKIVPLLEWAHSPRLTSDNNATNTYNIRKYACSKNPVGVCFYIVLYLLVNWKKKLKAVKVGHICTYYKGLFVF